MMQIRYVVERDGKFSHKGSWSGPNQSCLKELQWSRFWMNWEYGGRNRHRERELKVRGVVHPHLEYSAQYDHLYPYA